MKIGILQTGRVGEPLAPEFGEYPSMFAALFDSADGGFRYCSYAVLDGELPARPDECDAWVITGSKHGVYDPLPWIEPTKAFLRAARDAGRPIIGICFGHQILAEALGGRAEKSVKGWGIGVHEYQVACRPAWMASAPETIAIHAMHQDQVTAIPEDATVLASSPFCEYAMLAYGDPEAPDAISIQPHPEFGTGFAQALLEWRRGVVVPPEVATPAMETFGRPVHQQDFARWCANYLRRVAAGRAAA